MITLSQKFLDEASRANCKPVAIVGFIKSTFYKESAYRSTWDAGVTLFGASNVDTAAFPNEVVLAKTLASTGLTQGSANDNLPLLQQYSFRRLRTGGDGGYVWVNNTYLYWQEFTVPDTAYLNQISLYASKVIGANRSTMYIGITDANDILFESPFSIDSSLITNPSYTATVDFSSKLYLLQAGVKYKIFVTQSAIGQEGGGDAIYVFASTLDPVPSPTDGRLLRGVNSGPGTSQTSKDLKFAVTLQNRYQATGNISVKLDMETAPISAGEWVIEDVRDDGSNIVYTAWASDTGLFAGEETSLGTVVDGLSITVLKRYYKVTSSLSASANRLTSPRVIRIRANFDLWDRYALSDTVVEYKGRPFAPIVMAIPQLQYNMDILAGKATISKISVDFADDGLLEETIVNYYLKNNEIVIFIGFDADGWTFDDYIPLWRGNIVNWKRRTGIITLECADWAILNKKEIPVESYVTLSGTATFTQGSASVSGSGTSFSSELSTNSVIIGPDGAFYLVLSVGSNIALTLQSNYLGATVSGATVRKPPVIIPIEYDGHPSDIKKDILQNKINMRDSQIHFGSFDDPSVGVKAKLPGWRARRKITKPIDAWKLISELNELEGSVLIPREDGKLYDYYFDTTTPHVEEFGDNQIKRGGIEFNARMDQTLINTAVTYYGFHVPLALTGTVTFTNGSDTLTGTLTLFTKELSIGMEVQGPDSRIYRVLSITSDTSLKIESKYAGATATGPLNRPRTDDEENPSSYQGSVIVSDANSVINYKQVLVQRLLPSLWIGPDDVTYSGRQRAYDVSARKISWGKDGIAFAACLTSLQFTGLQVGDFIRLGARTTLPRNLIGFTWTKWVITNKTIDYSSKNIKWGLMKVPSGVAFSDELLKYSEWLEAIYSMFNVQIDQFPTEVILDYIEDASSDVIDTGAEWNAYLTNTNLTVVS